MNIVKELLLINKRLKAIPKKRHNSGIRNEKKTEGIDIDPALEEYHSYVEPLLLVNL